MRLPSAIFAAVLALSTPVMAYADAELTPVESDLLAIRDVKFTKNGPGSLLIHFVNTGSELLIVEKVISSTSALKVLGFTRLVEPGSSGNVTLSYNTSRVGKFGKTIAIISNDSFTPALTIAVEGNVAAN